MYKTAHFRLWFLSQQLNLENIKIQTVEFPGEGVQVSSVFVLLRELGQTMTVCPKYEIAVGSEKKPKHWFVLAVDATRIVVNKTICENVFLFKTKGHLRNFGPTRDLEIFLLADPGCTSFVRNTWNRTFARPRARPDRVRFGHQTRRLFRGPLQRTVCFLLILQREHQQPWPLCRIESRRHPQQWRIRRQPETPFSTNEKAESYVCM